MNPGFLKYKANYVWADEAAAIHFSSGVLELALYGIIMPSICWATWISPLHNWFLSQCFPAVQQIFSCFGHGAMLRVFLHASVLPLMHVTLVWIIFKVLLRALKTLAFCLASVKCLCCALWRPGRIRQALDDDEYKYCEQKMLGVYYLIHAWTNFVRTIDEGVTGLALFSIVMMFAGGVNPILLGCLVAFAVVYAMTRVYISNYSEIRCSLKNAFNFFCSENRQGAVRIGVEPRLEDGTSLENVPVHVP